MLRHRTPYKASDDDGDDDAPVIMDEQGTETTCALSDSFLNAQSFTCAELGGPL